jgi:hypothetical protein
MRHVSFREAWTIVVCVTIGLLVFFAGLHYLLKLI